MWFASKAKYNGIKRIALYRLMEKLDEALKTCPTCSKNYRVARMDRYCPNCASFIWVEDRYDPIPIQHDDISANTKLQQISTLFRTFKNFLQDN
jgi:ribosomal protein S27AE